MPAGNSGRAHILRFAPLLPWRMDAVETEDVARRFESRLVTKRLLRRTRESRFDSWLVPNALSCEPENSSPERMSGEPGVVPQAERAPSGKELSFATPWNRTTTLLLALASGGIDSRPRFG